MSTATSDNRRRSPRVPVRVPLRVETPDGVDHELEALDFGAGGVLVRSDEMLPPCSVCRVRGTGWASSLNTEATVVHMQDRPDGFGFGLWFDRLDRERGEELLSAARNA